MSRPFVYRPPNPPARRAGVLLIVLGGIALLIGFVFTFSGLNLAALAKDPAVAEKLDQLRKQIPYDLKTVIVGYGVVILLYALVAITLGILVRGANSVVMIVTLVAALAMTGLFGLFALVSLASAPDGAIFPLIILAVHGVVVAWMIAALRQSASSPAAAVPGVYRPMQDYYLPPLPTSNVARHP